jgi:UDP-2-acetamido-3-amino-2,3-dideoxy-glucuronate N-acetyltransferase
MAEDYFVHESSYVDEGARVGEGTKIWHFSHVMAGARIGARCSIGQNVNIGAKAVVGNGVKIQNNVSVYDDVILEDEVFCGPSCVFTNVINPRAFVERKDEYMQTRVKHGASIGANATVVCGTTLGRYSFIGAGSVVTKDVPDHALVYGSPARHHGWVCKCGVKLGADLSCPECGEVYVKSETGLQEK